MLSLNLRPAAPALERRQLADPDIALLQALQGSASPTFESAYAAELVAVLSEVAAVWARRLALATADHPAITPDVLWRVGHGLAFYGHAVEVIEADPVRGVRLCPAYYHEVDGRGTTPDDWLYHVDISTPDYHDERYIRGAGLLHFRLPGPEPWRGEHVLQRATETKALLVRIERHLVDESGQPSKAVLPLPEGVGEDTRSNLRAELMNRIKRVLLPATTTAAEGEGRTQAPLSDWKFQRLRAEPTAEIIQLRQELREQVLHSFGVPPSSTASTPSGLRDADRVLRQTIDSVAAICMTEMAAKMDRPVRLTFPPAPADVTMQARSIKGLIDAGIPLAEAKQIVGLA